MSNGIFNILNSVEDDDLVQITPVRGSSDPAKLGSATDGKYYARASQLSSGTPSDLANDPDTTTGLTYGYKAATLLALDGSGVANVLAGTVVLTDNAEQSVVFDFATSSVISVVDPGIIPPTGVQTAFVTTAAGEITLIVGKRSFLNPAARFFQSAIADGGFASAIGLDLTVAMTAQSSILFADQVSYLDGTTVTLSDNVLNYVEFENVAGFANLVTNTVGFTLGKLPVAGVVTASGAITSYNDVRPFASVPAPAGPTQQFIATGNTPGDITVNGILPGDRLDSVLRFTTGALISVLTFEFTIIDESLINNTGGTDTTGSTLLVTWTDLTP